MTNIISFKPKEKPTSAAEYAVEIFSMRVQGEDCDRLIEKFDLPLHIHHEIVEYLSLLHPLIECLDNTKMGLVEYTLIAERNDDDVRMIMFGHLLSENHSMITYHCQIDKRNNKTIDSSKVEQHYKDGAGLITTKKQDSKSPILSRHLDPVLNNMIDYATFNECSLRVQAVDGVITMYSTQGFNLQADELDYYTVRTTTLLNKQDYTITPVYFMNTPVIIKKDK